MIQNQTETPVTAAPEEFRITPIVTLKEMKARYVQWVVARFGGNKQAAADALGVTRLTVGNILKKNEGGA